MSNWEDDVGTFLPGEEEEGEGSVPYREVSDLAIIGDGLRTTIEDIQEHDVRITEFECFAAGREVCSGDAVLDVVEHKSALHLSRLRMLAAVVLPFLLGMAVMLGVVTAELRELQQRIQVLEEAADE